MSTSILKDVLSDLYCEHGPGEIIKELSNIFIGEHSLQIDEDDCLALYHLKSAYEKITGESYDETKYYC